MRRTTAGLLQVGVIIATSFGLKSVRRDVFFSKQTEKQTPIGKPK